MKPVPKHIIIPALLLIYLIVMIAFFGIRLYRQGEYAHFFSVTGVSLAMIVLLYFTLRCRQKIHDKNKNHKK